MPETKGERVAYYTKNICPLFSCLIMQGMCTLRELEEYYSFDDVLTMVEILSVKNTNENDLYERQSKNFRR